MTTALYRRYRPETFAEVIGQDHVTAPLRQALRSGQVNHAYLFSGPRGCGKTSSARILARVLNCAQNTAASPTDTPCGVCPSCVELATGGPGSLDVVEIDAASHGGVDDARELRERATFAPARDRFKVFILDEAHMVTPQGFNALLKIVEEPPPHVKFVFATTEPDKVIGTIRSRTHHYPFRLVPPDVLVPFLEQVCTAEGVAFGAGVLPLVVRAGGGSVRDSLSVLDQLIAGSGPEGLVYEPAVALLGYTPAALLDDLVEALAARDGGAAFRVVERVISTGHEPRRFVEDLLERLRDLIVIAASGSKAAAVLRDVPADQLERMRQQSAHLGAAELSRSADLADAALTEMVGATSPRLQLELLMARLLLPAADDSRVGLGARLDRLERAVGPGHAPTGAAAAARPEDPAPRRSVPDSSVPDAVGVPTGGPSAVPAPSAALSAVPAPSAAPASAAAPSAVPAPVVAPAPVGVPAPDSAPAPAAAPDPSARRTPTTGGGTPAGPRTPTGAGSPAAAPAPADAGPAPAPAAAPGAARSALDTEMLRRRWPEVIETIRRMRKFTHALVQDNALPLTLDDTTLRLGFAHPGHVTAFRGGQHAEVVVTALHEALGVEVTRVEAVLNDGAEAPAPAAAGGSAPGMPSRAQAEASWQVPVAPAGGRPAAGRPAPHEPAGGRRDPGVAVPSAGPSAARDGAATGAAGPVPGAGDAAEEIPPAEPPDEPSDESVPPPWDDEPSGPTRPAGPDGGVAGAMSARRPTGPVARPAPAPVPVPEDEPSPDDPDLAGSGLVGAPLVAQILGGQVIDEQVDGAL